MQKRKNDVKARTTLLLALPDEHQLRFNKYKTAQELWDAILKTFGGNKATKKTKNNQLKQYHVFASSAVTYTSVYTDYEPWRFYRGSDEESADAGSLRVIDQPLPDDASPTVLSPGYVADSDPNEDPKEDLEEDHTDYPADGGDGDDEPSDDDYDDDDTDDENKEASEDEDDDEEKEEHLASADSSAIPVVDPIPSAGDTEAFETDESAPTPRSPQTKSSTAGDVRQPCLLWRPTLGETRLGRCVIGLQTLGMIVEAMLEIASTTLEGVNKIVIELATTIRQDTEEEVTYARRVWTGSENRSAAIKAYVMTLEAQVKFSTCTLQGNALTWWNFHVKTVGHDVAYAMPWKTLKKMITDKYCPMGEIKKLETELWNLKVKGTDVLSYNQRFQELALMCDRMFPEESDEVEKYVGGLPDMIHGSVKASKPKTMQEAIEFVTELMDQKILTLAERQAEKKRKFEDTSRNNQN
nr:reverse transcriptase domain-containing protein [Tanacetum cinerariifolium]